MVGVDWGEFVKRVGSEGKDIDGWIIAGLDGMNMFFWPTPTP